MEKTSKTLFLRFPEFKENGKIKVWELNKSVRRSNVQEDVLYTNKPEFDHMEYFTKFTYRYGKVWAMACFFGFVENAIVNIVLLETSCC
jgi:hypothetical protein